MAKRKPTPEALTTALVAARDELRRLRRIFSDPYFTDRYDDAGAVGRVISFVNDTLDGKKPDASTLPVEVV